MYVFLISAKSTFENPGPMITLRPRFPNALAELENTEEFWTYVTNVALPLVSGLKPTWTGPLTLGRTVGEPVSAVLVVTKLMGLPVCRVMIADSAQPSFSR